MPQCKKCYRGVRRGVLCYRYGCPSNAPAVQPDNGPLAFITAELSALRPLRDFSNVQPEDDLFDDLGLDSLDIVTLALALEERYAIDLPDRTVKAWRTVGDIVAAVAAGDAP